MDAEGKAKRVRIYVTDADKIGHDQAHTAILSFLHHENAAGATVLRAIEGFGSTGEIHSANIAEVHWKLPDVIEWIDSPERVERLLPRIKQMLQSGVITVEDTDVVFWSPTTLRQVSKWMTADEVMTKDFSSVSATTTVKDIIRQMHGKGDDALPVTSAGRLVGIVTSSDLVNRGENTTAADVMTANPRVVTSETPLTDAAELMARTRMRRLPVLDLNEQLVGMLSRVDVLRSVGAAFSPRPDNGGEHPFDAQAPATRMMRSDVPLLKPETKLPDVMNAVISTRMNRALVVDDDRHVLGVVSDQELLERITPALRPGAIKSFLHRFSFHPPSEDEQHARAQNAEDLMSREIPKVPSETPLGRIADEVLSGTIVVAIVDQDDRLLGVVDRADVLRSLLRA